jgi:hypothetical protein
MSQHKGPTKHQRFELALHFGSLVDICPTLELLSEIEQRIPTDLLGDAARFVFDKLTHRLADIRDTEVKLVMGEMRYTLDEAEAFIYARLVVLGIIIMELREDPTGQLYD